MLLKSWRFATVMLVALSMATAMCHLLELPAKIHYDAALSLTLPGGAGITPACNSYRPRMARRPVPRRPRDGNGACVALTRRTRSAVRRNGAERPIGGTIK